MVKRYQGGFITSNRIAITRVATSGFYNKNTQIQALTSGTWPVILSPYQTDPYFMYTTVLLSGDTLYTASITNDASPNKFSLTSVGNAQASRFTPYTTGYYSYNLTPGYYLTITDNPVFDFAGDFTIELWYNFYTNNATSGSGPTILSGTNDAGSWLILQDTTGFTMMHGGGTVFSGSATTAFGEFFHFAVTRSGSTLRMFKNGVQIGSATSSATFSCNGSLYVGAQKPGSGFSYSVVSNLRIVNGRSLYNTAFLPPSTPLTAVANTVLLTCNSPTLVDNSPYNHTITSSGTVPVITTPMVPSFVNNSTSGSAYFDGTGDYLTIPANSAFYLSTGNWTMEAWVYKTTSDRTVIAAQSQNNASPYAGWNFQVNASGYLVFEGTNSSSLTSSSTLLRHTWNHVAAVKSGSTITLYLNGVSIGFSSVVSITDYSTQFAIGSLSVYSSSWEWAGYISDFRFVKGFAVYTGNFTPPTRSLSNSGAASAICYSNTANVNTTFPAANTVLLTLQYNQPHNNHTVLDKSNNNIVISRAGNATQGSFSPYGDRWSNYFDGTGDGLTVSSTSSQFSFAGDFTWEAWINPFALPSSGGFASIICSRGTTASNSAFQFNLKNVSGTYSIEATISIGATDYGPNWNIPTAPTLGTWYHVAIVRSGSSVQAYWNGTAIGSAQTASGTTNTPTVNPSIGFRGGSYNDLYFTGYIFSLRYVKGTAVYTGNFTVPTAPLVTSGNSTIYSNTANVNTTFAAANTSLLTCQSARFIDNSVNNFTITKNGDAAAQRFSPFTLIANASPVINGGSMYFDGSGDYLTSADNTTSNLSMGSWTVECWAYPTVVGAGYKTLITKRSSGNAQWELGLDPSNYLYFYTSSVYVSALVIPYNAWTHVAATYNGTTLRLFVNGTTVLMSAGVTATPGTSPVYIGSIYPGGGQAYGGYISDLRVVKGTAVYTGNFTPPTSPVVTYGTSTIYSSNANVNVTFAETNTAILCNFTDAAITDATTSINLETVADAKIFTANSKFGGSAMYFDGTGDYLSLPVSPALILAASNFTIELWLYLPTLPGTRTNLFYHNGNSSGYNAIALLITSSNKLGINFSESGSSWKTEDTTGVGTTLTAGIWQHIAVVRNGQNIQIYLNGVAQGSPYTTTAATTSLMTTHTLNQIGTYNSAYYFLNGYIDDFRITKYARYTTNFTPSTIPSPLR